MRLLQNILSNLPTISIHGTSNREVNTLCIDSRLVKEGSMFIAIKGSSVDGHQFIATAIKHGATSILCETVPTERNDQVTYIQVQDAGIAAGLIASAFYNNPSSTLKVVGITGTNGKTTCATLLFQLFTQLGYTCGLISTVQNQIGHTILPSTHNT